MSNFKYIWVAAALGLGASLTSCNDMDLDPKGILAENTLLKSDEGIKYYLSVIYQDLPIEDFNYGQNGDQIGYAVTAANGYHPGNQWQPQKSSPASTCAEACGRATEFGDGWDYWDVPYARIHDINNTEVGISVVDIEFTVVVADCWCPHVVAVARIGSGLCVRGHFGYGVADEGPVDEIF